MSPSDDIATSCAECPTPSTSTSGIVHTIAPSADTRPSHSPWSAYPASTTSSFALATASTDPYETPSSSSPSSHVTTSPAPYAPAKPVDESPALREPTTTTCSSSTNVTSSPSTECLSSPMTCVQLGAPSGTRTSSVVTYWSSPTRSVRRSAIVPSSLTSSAVTVTRPASAS